MQVNAQPAMALRNKPRTQSQFPPLRSGTLRKRFHKEPSKTDHAGIRQEFRQLEREYRNYEGNRAGQFKGRSPTQDLRKKHGAQAYMALHMTPREAFIHEITYVAQGTTLTPEAIAKLAIKNLRGAGYKI